MIENNFIFYNHFEKEFEFLDEKYSIYGYNKNWISIYPMNILNILNSIY